MDEELVSGIRIGSRNPQRLVEVSEHIIIGTQLHESLPNRSQVPDLRPCVLKHCRPDQSAGNLLARCRHVSFEEQRKPDLALEFRRKMDKAIDESEQQKRHGKLMRDEHGFPVFVYEDEVEAAIQKGWTV